MPEDNQSAWIAAMVAIISLAATIIVQLVLRFLDRKHEREAEILRLRREGLHKALGVIDRVYANSPEFGAAAHPWDIMYAREAWNMMLLYCKKPRAATDAFAMAIGLRNETETEPKKVSGASLVAFRRIIATELGLPESQAPNPEYLWITTLPGSIQSK